MDSADLLISFTAKRVIRMQVSMLSAFQPQLSQSAQARVQHANRFFIDALGHPSILGHRTIADVLMYNVHWDVSRSTAAARARPQTEASCGGIAAPPAVPATAIPPPLYISSRQADMYSRGGNAAVRVDLRDATKAAKHVASVSGFAFKEDVVGKPGLLARRAGASVVIWLTQAGGAAEGVTSLGHLASYQDVGAFSAAIFATSSSGTAGTDVIPCTDNELPSARRLHLQSTVFESHMDDRVSIYKSVELDWALRSRHKPSINRTWCVYLNVTSLSDDKVKLYDVTTYLQVQDGDSEHGGANELLRVEGDSDAVRKQASRWLRAARPGYCAATERGEGNCSRDDKGAFPQLVESATWAMAAEACVARCLSCARCHHLSISLDLMDCSWYNSCATLKTDVPGVRSAAVTRR